MDHSQQAVALGLDSPRHLLIGGELRETKDHLVSVDPSTGESLAEVPNAAVGEVSAAVAAARDAFDHSDWRRNISLRKRSLLALSELARRDSERLALTDCLDVGMLSVVARRFGVKALVRNLEYFSTWADKVYGELVPVTSGRIMDFTRREPYGVVAAVYAWNTPSLFLGSKLGPALAAGNTVVVKPSELGSLSALHFASLCIEAGLPPGVVNIITGGPDCGRQLVAEPGLDKISFTGGTETGRRVHAAAAERLTPLHLELGGKSPHLIMADADLDRALMAALSGAFALSGQACAAGSRLLLDASIHDEFLERLCTAIQGLSVGDPLEKGTFIGPLISERQAARVTAYVETGCREGADLLTGGKRLDRPGFFVSPALFAGVDRSMTIAREEIFGPVLSVMRVEDFEQGIAAANDTEFGLAAGIWTSSVKKALVFAEEVRAGNVWVNGYGTVPHTVPFGGYGMSGQGREGGREAILEYTQVKNVAVDLT